MKYALTFDSTPSVRTKDENGFLHVALTPISKATVNPYLGKEIEGSKEHGFEPDKIYYGLRDPDELAKGAGTFNGLPLLLEHHPTDAENLPKEWVVGSMGTDAVFEKPYLKNSLTVTDAQAIQYIEDGTAKEISCSYRFTPDFTAGEYTEADGSKVHYDFIMRDIKGNHVALVPEGRAGHDVKVADGIDAVKYIANEERRSNMPIDDFIAKFMPLASDEEKAAAKAALEALAPAKDEEPTFAEGVSYGEKLEKEEPKKLDSEHESEGMEKKLDGDEAVEEVKDACGKDEELPVDEENLDELMKDPKFKAAYEMGVRYGEKREKADPEKIDADHEREGMERALGEDSVKAIEKRITDKLRSINDAAKKVRPLVGEIANPFAFDSAESVYKFALEKNGKDVKKYPASAYEGMVDMILEHKPVVAEDSAMSGDIGGADEFMKALKKIRK
jgi:hypothetical protein